ncbi:cell wall metabolism sensor histidine kinase WalK [Tissierella creatinini]|nr:cell wall metabolism sensor histidine kinase WalK [Tissierella creatinini]TJX61926.1 cell wall metabolism sensor histidine kinase WalK [Soehngenia saccharolytica]
MISSIKWRFVFVYFLLVFIAMAIVGIFIVGRLEDQQIKAVTRDMEQEIQSISSSISDNDWLENASDIQNTIDEWPLGSNQTLYVIYDEDIPTIIASNAEQKENVVGYNALSNKYIDPIIVQTAFNGDKGESIIEELNENIINKHLSYPVYSSMGKLNGVLYMTYNLENVYNTVNESKTILTSATFLALGITIFLGFLIASSITEPIRDVTKKAEEMAMGDFDQFVDVKSDDEIGQLASMFNHLTLKLKETIQDMDLERSKLDTIFNYMAEGVVAVDTNGYIIHVNPIAMDILGLDEGLSYGEEKIDLLKLNIHKIDYTKKENLEGSVTTKINSKVYKIKYAPFNNEKNIVGGLIVVFQDITQEHKLDNMRKEFVANVSHELKTPITTIKSYTETLLDNELDKVISQKFLSVIDSESDRMARLVRDLLQLSNIDYNKTNWKRTEVSICDMIRDIISKLDLLIKEKDHKLELDLRENLPSVIVDKDGMEQVILNIISNAIKYTENNGKINISVYSIDKELVIKVKDNGIGIPKDDQHRIFERFYRVEKGRSREMGGTGLGLSIAKEIIDAHDGRIEINSVLEEGTEVTLTLPLV